jgi:uncharacterized protein YbjT (DUF2867 family)
MRIVVIGASGLIGSTVAAMLEEHGHEVVAASPNSGVNTLTGEGLADAVRGAQVVVDVSNSPSFADDDVMRFFETSTGNLLAAEEQAGVMHHVALSVVGAERLPESGYLRAKVRQEELIRASGIPYSIVHATQFFEFAQSIAEAATEGATVRLPHVLFQPIAAEDAARAVARTAAGDPVNGVIEVAGPDQYRFDVFSERARRAQGDAREVVADPDARYFGTQLTERSLVPVGDAPRLGELRYEEWLDRAAIPR